MEDKSRDEVWQRNEAEEPIIVSGFEGGAPGLWFSLSFIVFGLLNLLGASSPHAWKPTEDGTGAHGMGMLFFGGVLTLLGGWFLRTRWQIEALTPLPMLCKLLGKNEAQIQAMAYERGVRPRYVVNGLEYYASSDLVDSEALLRASETPRLAPEALLRPAASTLIEPNTLLRIPGRIESSEAPTASQQAPECEPILTVESRITESPHDL